MTYLIYGKSSPGERRRVLGVSSEPGILEIPKARVANLIGADTVSVIVALDAPYDRVALGLYVVLRIHNAAVDTDDGTEQQEWS